MKVGPVAWLIQRVCAVFLIVGAPIKLLTGYAMVRKLTFISTATAFSWHSNSTLDIMLVFGASFHVFYGVRTILIDLGVSREKELFWLVTLLSLLFSLIVIYYAYVG